MAVQVMGKVGARMEEREGDGRVRLGMGVKAR